MGALFDLADGAETQLLQGPVIQLTAVIVAHARTRPDPDHKVNLLVNGLVSRGQSNGVMPISYSGSSDA
jgi:hypothetical protein